MTTHSTKLTDAEQEVLNEIDTEPYPAFCIPERKSSEMTPELWEKLKILKNLVYKGKIRFDISFERRCYVFYSNDGCSGHMVWPEDPILSAEYLEVKENAG